MATPIKELKAPANVSRDKMYQELVKKERREEKVEEENTSFMARATAVGTGAVVAFASGALYARFPRMKSIDKAGKFETAPLMGAGLILGGFFAPGILGDALLGAGQGFGYPFLARWGAKMGAP